MQENWRNPINRWIVAGNLSSSSQTRTGAEALYGASIGLAFIWLFIELLGTSTVNFFATVLNSEERQGRNQVEIGWEKKVQPLLHDKVHPTAQINCAASPWTSGNLANFPHHLAQKVWESHKIQSEHSLLIKIKPKSVTAEMPQVTVLYKLGTAKDFILHISLRFSWGSWPTKDSHSRDKGSGCSLSPLPAVAAGQSHTGLELQPPGHYTADR